MSTELYRIALKAKANPKIRFTSLAHLLTPEFLKETWKQINRRAASGIDGETMEQFETNLDKRVKLLVESLKAGNYKAPLIKRVKIPKGHGKTRPLGINTVEDRLVQRAIARILGAVFDQDFLEVSYGYRPGRGPHGALKALRSQIVTKKVRYLYEADIQGYFTKINHQWLRKMVAQRIADKMILRLINKWLKAGVMVNGVVVRQEEGTSQGGPASCILANIYLHYVLDLRLILDTINSKKTMQFISLFNKSFDKELKIFDKINKLSSLMTGWMEKSEELLDFSIAKSCILQDPNKQTRRIRCQQQDLLSPNIQALLKDGYKVKQLALNWRNQIDFILDNRLLLSSIKLQDQIFEQEKIKEDSLQQQFCSKLLLELDVVSRLIEDLLQIIITNKAKELIREYL